MKPSTIPTILKALADKKQGPIVAGYLIVLIIVVFIELRRKKAKNGQNTKK